MAPLSKTPHAAWGDVYELKSEALQITISPQVGAIVSVTRNNGDELLQAPLEISAVNSPDTLPVSEFWENRAWRTSEGRQVVMLSHSFGPPLSLRIVHIIELSAKGNALTQTTRITGMGPGDQKLLSPFASIYLTVPDAILAQNEKEFLVYENQLCHWASQWEIELPALNLGHEITREQNEAHVHLSSKPDQPLSLPPQGWSLICQVNLNLSLLDSPPQTYIELWPLSEKQP